VAISNPNARTYPWTESINGRTISYRLMTPEDRSAVLKFTQALPDTDLMFLRIDITKPEVVDEWVHNIETNQTVTVLAKDDRKVVGYGSLHHNQLMWTRHLGELHVMVARDWRHRGLGRRLAAEVFHLAKDMGLARIIIQIAADQPRVRALFERMGFVQEALLTDWIMSRDGATHNLLVMTNPVDHYKG